MKEAFTIDELIERLKEIRELEGNLPVALSDENDGCHKGVRVYCSDVAWDDWDDEQDEKPEHHCCLERY